jgi:hypothetical protein
MALQMSRTLLPVFKRWKSSAGIESLEVNETFHWIPNEDQRYNYEMARSALDNNPGSRDYLKSYNSPGNGANFMDPMGFKLLADFGGHHSGASATLLAYSYKNILNDWDGFVLDTKRYYAKLEYNKTQLTNNDIRAYKSLGDYNAGNLAIDCEIIALKKEFLIQYDVSTVKMMLDDLINEKNDEALQATLDRLNI